MSLITQVKARLEAQVALLAGRIQGANEFAQVLNQATPMIAANVAAYLVPLGMVPDAPDDSAGGYTQMVGHNIGIFLMMRTFAQPQERSEVSLEDLIAEVLAGVLGWGPDDVAGVATLISGELQPVQSGGLLFYSITIQIRDQLRVLS